MGDQPGAKAVGSAGKKGEKSPPHPRRGGGGEGERSWANVIQGRSWQPTWTNFKITDEEVENLRCFTEVLELPVDQVESSQEEWEGFTVITRSLGRRILAEWIAKELRIRGKLEYEVEAFNLVEDHCMFRFKSEKDRDAALVGGPWVIAGHLVAMEPWVPGFVSGLDSINTTVVWVRMPKLPVEYWKEGLIQKIASAAGRPIALDSFTDHLQKLRYARAKVEIDVRKPLKPGMQIRGRTSVLWQSFVYENLPTICFSCGQIGHHKDTCKHPPPAAGDGSSPPLQPGNILNPSPLAVEGESACHTGRSLGRRRAGVLASDLG